MNLLTPSFESVSVILPVMDETTSLTKTVDIILRDSRPYVKELIIVVGEGTTSESLDVIASLKKRFADLIHIHHQKLPFVGGAIREAFDIASASHLIIMASDLETDPDKVIELIAEAQNNPNSIIAASRWLKGSKFTGYSKSKLIANWLFQQTFSLLYGTVLTDMTYAYRLYPIKVLQSITWQELKHPFFFETLVKPLRLGVKVIEIPCVWRARTEGKSHNSFFDNFDYFRIGLRVRFTPVNSFLKSNK